MNTPLFVRLNSLFAWRGLLWWELEVLSLRKRQVLEMIAQGTGNQETSRTLALSHKTITRHRERIMKKLNMHSRESLFYQIYNRIPMLRRSSASK